MFSLLLAKDPLASQVGDKKKNHVMASHFHHSFIAQKEKLLGFM